MCVCVCSHLSLSAMHGALDKAMGNCFHCVCVCTVAVGVSVMYV